MKPRHIISARDAHAIFDRAVEERALAVLTMQDGNDWTTFKSRFLERDGNGRFFVLDYESVDGAPLPAVAPGQYVGVSFRQRSRKILFATVIEAKGHYVREDQTSVAAIRYRWPETLTELQRRAYYRTPVPGNITLRATLWAGGAAARVQNAATTPTVGGELANLSCGGAFIRLNQPAPSTWNDNDLLGAELHMPDGRPPLLLDVRFRGTRAEDSGLSGAAIQFLGLELTVEGRHVLQRLAQCLQRLYHAGQAAGEHSKPGIEGFRE